MGFTPPLQTGSYSNFQTVDQLSDRSSVCQSSCSKKRFSPALNKGLHPLHLHVCTTETFESEFSLNQTELLFKVEAALQKCPFGLWDCVAVQRRPILCASGSILVCDLCMSAFQETGLFVLMQILSTGVQCFWDMLHTHTHTPAHPHTPSGLTTAAVSESLHHFRSAFLIRSKLVIYDLQAEVWHGGT